MERSLPHIAFESFPDCNLNCIYCYNHWKREPRQNHIEYSHRKAKKSLQKLFQQTKVKRISFTGGEPLLNRYVEELILISKLNNSKVTIISNGNSQKDDNYVHLKKLDVDLLMFPMHSASRELHDEMTAVKGSWDKSYESILCAMSLGIYVVPVIVLTKVNYKEVRKTLVFLNSLSLKRISVNRYNIGGAGLNSNNVSLSHSELRETFSTINETAKEFNLMISSNVCTPYCVIDPDNYPNLFFGSFGSDQYKRPITLDTEGNIRACNHSPVIAGNIYKNDIFEILESDYIRSWNTTRPDHCSTCSVYDKCFGGCRAASEQLGKSILHADPIIFNV